VVVVVLEKVPNSLRGYLSRWMLEVHSGTYVGDLGRRVRETLWEEICCHTGTGSAFIVYSSDNEQGFRFEFWGVPRRRIRNFDGLQLIEIYDIPASQAKHAKRIWTTGPADDSPREQLDI
jgi:CRISPR-associated protein Cas2